MPTTNEVTTNPNQHHTNKSMHQHPTLVATVLHTTITQNLIGESMSDIGNGNKGNGRWKWKEVALQGEDFSNKSGEAGSHCPMHRRNLLKKSLAYI